MSEKSPRMELPYPSREADPWYDLFVNYVNAVDASEYASREDRHLIFMGGGTIDWDLASETMTWTDQIAILSAITGRLWIINAGSLVLSSGSGIIFYVELNRAPGENATLTAAAANSLSAAAGNNALAIVFRRGNSIFFRTGISLGDGESVDGISPVVGSGGVGVGSYITIALAYSYIEAASPVEETMGHVTFDGSLATTVTLKVVLTPALTMGNCSVILYDLGPVGAPTAPRLVSTLTTAVATGIQRLQQIITTVAATPGANEILQADHFYEIVVTSAAQVGDSVFVGSARIEVS